MFDCDVVAYEVSGHYLLTTSVFVCSVFYEASVSSNTYLIVRLWVIQTEVNPKNNGVAYIIVCIVHRYAQNTYTERTNRYINTYAKQQHIHRHTNRRRKMYWRFCTMKEEMRYILAGRCPLQLLLQTPHTQIEKHNICMYMCPPTFCVKENWRELNCNFTNDFSAFVL